MLINIQFDEAAELLWELYKAIPEERRAAFTPRVDKIASCLQHPNLDGAVVYAFGRDLTDKIVSSGSDVVLPLERSEVANRV